MAELHPAPPPVVSNDRAPRWLWLVVLAIFGILILLQLSAVTKGAGKRPGSEGGVVAFNRDLRFREIVEQRIGTEPGVLDNVLLEAARERFAGSDEKDAPVYVALIDQIRGKPIEPETWRRLESRNPGYATYFRAESRAAQFAAIGKLPPDPPKGAIMGALLSSGERPPPSILPTLVLGFLGVLAALIVAGAIVGWALYFTTPHQRAFGHPLEPMGPWRSAFAAIRTLQLLAVFFLASIAREFFPRDVGLCAAAILIVLGTVLVLRAPIRGHELGFRELGLRRPDWLRLVGTGLIGWTMVLPVVIVLAAIGAAVSSRFLPPPSHPVSEMLPQATPVAIIGIFLATVVQAAFWEEALFRGFLFPGLAYETKSVVGGALLSSFLFASIHAQGPALWLALGAIGFMSCMLAHRTKSLIPSMALHAAHNATLVIVGLFVSSQGFG